VASTAGTDVVDSVIVTAPVGVLQAGRIAFDPQLPPAVLWALDHLGTGVLAKAFFEFDTAFWRPNWSFWTTATPRPAVELWVDTSQLAGRPVLCGFVTGANVARVERMSSDELCAMAHELLSRVPELSA